MSDPVLFAYSLDGSGGGATLHNGGGPTTGVTHFFEQAMVTDDLRETAAIL